MFDTADMYGNRGGSELWPHSRPHRKDIVLASKFGLPMGEGPYLNGAAGITSCAPWKTACAACAPTIWTCRFIAPTPRRQSRRPCARSMTVRDGKVRYVGRSTSPAGRGGMGGTRRRHRAIYLRAERIQLGRPRIEGELVPAANAYGVGILLGFANGLLAGVRRPCEARRRA